MKMIIFLLFVIFNILDVITTNKAIAKGAMEMNPIVRFFMKIFGSYWWIAKMLVAIIAGYILYRAGSYAFVILVVLTIIYGVIVWRNWKILGGL